MDRSTTPPPRLDPERESSHRADVDRWVEERVVERVAEGRREAARRIRAAGWFVAVAVAAVLAVRALSSRADVRFMLVYVAAYAVFHVGILIRDLSRLSRDRLRMDYRWQAATHYGTPPPRRPTPEESIDEAGRRTRGLRALVLLEKMMTEMEKGPFAEDPAKASAAIASLGLSDETVGHLFDFFQEFAFDQELRAIERAPARPRDATHTPTTTKTKEEERP